MSEPEPAAPAALGDSELLERIRGRPIGQQLLREREDAQLGQRQRWAEEMEAAQAEHERELPPLTAAETAARNRVTKAESALRAAQESWRGAQAARADAAGRFNRRRDELERQLRETAPPEIDAFIREMGSEWESARRVTPTVRFGGVHPVTREKLPDTSNYESIKARVLGLREAQVQAEALKLRALGPEELNAALQAIRDAVPAIERFPED